jgi:hypothetical protein
MDDRLIKDSKIEDALKTYPLASMPRDITASVMTRIQKDTRPVLFTWNDIAISMVVLCCAIAIFFTIQNLPPIIVMEIRKQTILAYQGFLINSRWLIPSILFGLSAFFAALTIPYLGRQLNKS